MGQLRSGDEEIGIFCVFEFRIVVREFHVSNFSTRYPTATMLSSPSLFFRVQLVERFTGTGSSFEISSVSYRNTALLLINAPPVKKDAVVEMNTGRYR